jgi:hypothetical protein
MTHLKKAVAAADRLLCAEAKSRTLLQENALSDQALF